MRPELVGALEPVLRDLAATCLVRPRIEPYGDLGVWLYEPDGSGAVVAVGPHDGPVEGIVGLADQVSDWAVEALWSAGHPAAWPECPQHPGSHPLQAALAEGRPVWQCPRSAMTVEEIGSLA